MGSSRPFLRQELPVLGLLLVPLLVLLCLGGPGEVLFCNGLSTHDGIQYFGVSLDPLGTTPYCAQPFRYSRMLFPTAVFLVATVVALALRLLGLGEWLHQPFVFAGHELPHVILIQAYVYHGGLVLVSWLAVRPVADLLGSRRAAVLLVAVLLQAAVFRGLLLPLDLLLTALCLRAIRTWGEVRPTWRRMSATAGLLAAALLNREVFLLFVPVLVTCHLTTHGRHHLAKVAGVLFLGLLVPSLWYVAVSLVQGVNLFTEVLGFMRLNSTRWPFEAFPPFVRSGGAQGLLLAGAVVYAVSALVRVVAGEWRLFAQRRRLSAAGLWSLGVLLTFLRAGPLVLDSVGNYGRVLLLTPILLQDFAAVYAYLAARFGYRFEIALGVLGAGFLVGLVYYQYALYPAHLDQVNRATNFLNVSWLAKIDKGRYSGFAPN